jgi:acetyl-CoA carboxylase biotin carboxylase subunit
MTQMGDKASARQFMASMGMPIIPGTDGVMPDVASAREWISSVGLPVLLKAVAGGGGRGMRIVRSMEALEGAWSEATSESLAAFGDGRMYIEKLIEGGRHIEVQVVADGRGNAVHFGERECSLQRRHQKVLEEAPSPGLSAAERDRILPLVTDVVARAGYRNAGTIEMLLDAEGHLWFMEMNTRLQVEHPVSEAITGEDLVAWQLAVAANQPLPTHEAPARRGHAIEFRINAEDPDDGFKPCPGVVTRLDLPTGDGIRVDTHLAAGDRIPPHYDSMIAKLIVSGDTRDAAIERARVALEALVVEGVRTNIGLHKRILTWDRFLSGDYDTGALEAWLEGAH